MRLRCDSCGEPAPDVVAPILYGSYGWREFDIDGEHEGRKWRAAVLLCGRTCAPRMQAYVDAGGRADDPRAPRPPRIQTNRGGMRAEPEYEAPQEAHDGR